MTPESDALIHGLLERLHDVDEEILALTIERYLLDGALRKTRSGMSVPEVISGLNELDVSIPMKGALAKYANAPLPDSADPWRLRIQHAVGRAASVRRSAHNNN